MMARVDPRYRLLLLGTGGVLLGVLAVRFLFLPVVAVIGERRASLQALAVKAADASILVAQRSTHEQALRQAEQRCAVLDAQVRNQSVARILDALGQRAKAHRLELSVVQEHAAQELPRTVALGPELTVREVPLRVQLRGRYRQVAEFLGSLREAPFLATVQELTMTHPDETAQLKTDLLLAVYLAESG